MKNYITGIKFDGHADINLQLVHSDSGWKDALYIALVNFGKEFFEGSIVGQKAAKETIDSLPDDFEEAKQVAFDQGWDFNIKEV
jgi:hypothetical protein